eukprot:GHVU01230629.1.p1 GENE.GHVU01230629.1~~GHVU01230629.1.p1  ORF type:complete len:178 (-),score=29.92 GHVU01230629.1:892-1371(-)
MATPTPRVICIAVDPSDAADYAFDWYVNYLHNEGNRILIVHVPEGFDIDKAHKELARSGSMKTDMEKKFSKITELEEKFHKKMAHFKIHGQVLSVPGKQAGQVIIDTAREEKAFAILMGTRGRSKIKKALLGSVSDFVIKTAEIPVIVVRKPADDKAAE